MLPPHHLVLPRPLEHTLLERLKEAPKETLLVRLGQAVVEGERVEWLGRGLADRAELLQAYRGSLLVVRAHTGEGQMPYVESSLDLHPPAVKAELFLGIGSWEGRAWGFVRTSDGSHYQALAKLSIPGPGMEVVPLLAQAAADSALPQRNDGLWSRTRGALGRGLAGRQAFRRLQGLRVLLVGAGRTGGLLAEWLAVTGLSFAVLDADDLETHNLGEGSALLTTEDVGKNKAEALASRLGSGTRKDGIATGLPHQINTPSGLTEARRADVIVTACDHDAGRLSAALLAAAFLKPHLDVGTGVFFDEQGRRTLGADIRLALPGQAQGCLHCLGGFSDYNGALATLTASRAVQQSLRRARSWDQERSGSLRSLNMAAAGLGLRLLEDMVADRVQTSRWLRLEFGEHGEIQTRTPAATIDADCPLCRKSGEGDAAFGV